MSSEDMTAKDGVRRSNKKEERNTFYNQTNKFPLMESGSLHVKKEKQNLVRNTMDTDRIFNRAKTGTKPSTRAGIEFGIAAGLRLGLGGGTWMLGFDLW